MLFFFFLFSFHFRFQRSVIYLFFRKTAWLVEVSVQQASIRISGATKEKRKACLQFVFCLLFLIPDKQPRVNIFFFIPAFQIFSLLFYSVYLIIIFFFSVYTYFSSSVRSAYFWWVFFCVKQRRFFSILEFTQRNLFFHHPAD